MNLQFPVAFALARHAAGVAASGMMPATESVAVSVPSFRTSPVIPGRNTT
jgi:hypothetical protein